MLGGLRIENHSKPIALRGAKVQSLFAMLVLYPAVAHSRESLIDRLWPDSSPERARRFLSDTLYRLRQALGDDWLVIHGDAIQFQARDTVWVDVWSFERFTAWNSLNDLRAITDLYRGDLLPECFDDWIVARRTAVHDRFSTCLLRLGEEAEAHNKLDLAFTAYQRLSQVDPLEEAAHRGLMRVYTRLGRHRQALQQYEQLYQRLANELGSAPHPETAMLATTLRDEAELPFSPPTNLRLVGRRHERTYLLEQVEQAAQGRGGLICIEGEPGIGKTRLLESLAEGAAWRGLQVHWGRAREHAARSPFAPLDQALQTALSGTLLERVRTQLSPVAAAALTSFIPRLRTTALLQLTTPPDLSSALRSCLGTLAAETPQVLILDDVQWAGPEFWDLMVQCGQWRTMPLLIVLTYRSDAARTDERVWRGLCAIDSNAAPLRMTIGGLSPTDCVELAHELGYSLDTTAALTLHQATAGNPLHIIELLTASHVGTAGGNLLATLIQQRLALLSPADRATLEVAAVLGREFTHGLWQSISGAQVLTALPSLLDGRFLEETATGYRFHHDLLHEEVYTALGEQRRRELHAHVLTLLDAQAPAAMYVWHAQQAEHWSQAARWCRLAGEQALTAYAYEEALRRLEQALEYAQRSAPTDEELLALRRARLRTFKITGPMPALRAEIDLVEQLATRTENDAALLEGLEARINVLSLDSQPAQLETVVNAALTLATNLQDRAAEARIRRIYGLHLLLTSAARPHEALTHVEKAVRLADSTHDQHALVSALCTLGFAQRLLGQSTAAHASASRALALTEVRPELYPARADALRVLAEVSLNRAEWELARATLQTTIRLFEELQDRWPLAIAYFMATSIGYAMGQHADACMYVTKLQALVRAGEVATNSHWMVYVHTCAIDAAVHAGDLPTAEQIAQQAHGLVEQSDDVQASIYLLTAIGSLRLFQNRYRDAFRYLERAVRLWQQAPSGMMTPMLLHATAAHLLGKQAAAEASLSLVEQGLAGREIAYYNVSLYFTRFLVRGTPDDLRAAHAELQRQAALFRDARQRDAFLREVRLHRIVERLWHLRPLAGALRAAAGIWTQLTALYQPEAAAPTSTTAHTLAVCLAQANAPLGRALSANEHVLVDWTVDSGADDMRILQHHGKAALRHHRLRRLLDEAAAQGAAPTDDDLAAALGVSRRTILRDIEHLTQRGDILATRRRRP